MATINQPKPSEPKSPQQDTPPLQPGGPQISRSTTADPKRPNPDPEQDKSRDR